MINLKKTKEVPQVDMLEKMHEELDCLDADIRMLKANVLNLCDELQEPVLNTLQEVKDKLDHMIVAIWFND